MPRVIFKCPYLKAGTSASHAANLVEYIATRDGVDFVTEANRTLPATKEQKELIGKILKDIPDAKHLFEFEDYERRPTIENASEFITQALEQHLHEAGDRDYYVKYIAERPRVEKQGTHGLFTYAGEPVVVSRVQREISEHAGNIWTPIISLRREDAERLSYDSGRHWQALLRSHATEIAAHMKILPQNFRWYAAFHNEAHHPHVHMVCWSTNPKEGYLTEKGIGNIKSILARQIFRHELNHIYELQTDRRGKLNAESLETMRNMCEQIKTGICQSERLNGLIQQLSGRLSNTGGKKVYGFLKPDVKAIVDQIVDELANDERVAACYDAWYEMREEVLRTYRDELPPRVPLSAQKEFKQIKNMVIAEAMQVRIISAEIAGDSTSFYSGVPYGQDSIIPDALMLSEGDGATEIVVEPDMLIEPEDISQPDFELEEATDAKLHAMWTQGYKRARGYLFGSESIQLDFEMAFDLFMTETQTGNVLAMHDLGRMHADGLGRDIDTDTAYEWYAKALAGFLQIEPALKPDDRKATYLRYRIGKMYMSGLGTEQDYTEAASWLRMAADEGHKYAQYSLGSLYYRGLGVEQNFDTAFDLYSASAAQSNAYASYELAKMYRDGVGTQADAVKSNHHFEIAYRGFVAMDVQGADDKLQHRIGQMLRDGVGTETNIDEAEYYFERAAQLGNPFAQYALAKIYLSGGEPEKIAAAVELMQKSADSGNPTAQYALGKLFRDGNHVEKDIVRAVELFTKAAEQENDYAAYALGKIYLAGEDIQKDVPAAIRWFTESAEQGNQFAQYQLGKLYIAGEDLQKDVSAAVRWFIKSAEQGNQFAQYQLGKMYIAGEDIQKDVSAAINWFTKSAGQGSQFAQYQLGKLYVAGENLQKDVQTAIHWLTESANQGNQFAQYQHGKLYIMGRDVPRDRDEALRWFAMAAGQGNEYAQFFIDHIDEIGVHNPDMFLATTRLLRQLGKIFEQQSHQLDGQATHIDRKRMQKLREKKMAQGYAYNDHESKQTGGV